MAAFSASPARDQDRAQTHLRTGQETQAARSDVVGSEGAGRVATRATGPITTALRPAPLKGFAVFVDLSFERRLRSRGDDRLNHRFEERSEPPWQSGLAPLFSCAAESHTTTRGGVFRIMRSGEVWGGLRRGWRGHANQDSRRLFRSDKMRRSIPSFTCLQPPSEPNRSIQLWAVNTR